MLWMTFQLGADLYAIDAAQIEELLPLVDLQPLPQAPQGVAGFLNYRGTPTVALDLSQMTLGRPSITRLSTRIVILTLTRPHVGNRRVGLIVERASGVMRRGAEAFVETGYRTSGTPYLGPVAPSEDGRMVQRIDPSQLIRPDVLDALYAVTSEP